jgi:hypothetical protein
MDFMTAFPYWGIILIIILNAWVVSRMQFEIRDGDPDKPCDPCKQ